MRAAFEPSHSDFGSRSGYSYLGRSESNTVIPESRTSFFEAISFKYIQDNAKVLYSKLELNDARKYVDKTIVLDP